MSNKLVTKPLAVALGAAFVTSVSGVSVANAGENPFSMTELSSGYMVADAHEGKCGEGKCGGAKDAGHDGDKMKEGKCGEGKCGAAMDSEHEGDGDKMKEGKCGEGKCGGAK